MADTSERMKEIVKAIVDLQSGNTATVSSDGIATELARARPDLWLRMPWVEWLKTVRTAAEIYGGEYGIKGKASPEGYMISGASLDSPGDTALKRRAILEEWLDSIG